MEIGMKPAEEYYKDIYTMSTDDLVKRLAGMFSDIINDRSFEVAPELDGRGARSDLTDAVRMHEAVVASIKFIAVYFSPVYLDKPIEFPFANGHLVKADTDIAVKEIKDIADCLDIAQRVAIAISSADFTEIHGEKRMPSDRAIRRGRELFNRLQKVSSFLYMIEDVAREWLKRRDAGSCRENGRDRGGENETA